MNGNARAAARNPERYSLIDGLASLGLLAERRFLGEERERGARRRLVRQDFCAVEMREGFYGTASMRSSATSASRAVSGSTVIWLTTLP
jgi:hypothetical protein